MSAVIPDDIFIPGRANIFFEKALFPGGYTEAVIAHLEIHAGSTPGMATIFFPDQFPDNLTAGLRTLNGSTIMLGEKARVEVNGRTIFRGILLSGPVNVSTGADGVELMLLDEKRMLSDKVIGQVDIGTVTDLGFTDVGFEIIFNKDSMPDKNDTGYDFSIGSTSVYWTLRDILQFVFDYYIDAALMTLSATEVAHAAWDATPHDLSLIGQTPAQALDTLAELAGESWAAIVDSTSMSYRSVRPGNGAIRNIQMLRPQAATQVSGITDEHANDVRVDVTIANAKDTFDVHSGPIVIESVYSIANSLLYKNDAYIDKEWKCRCQVNVTQYANNGIGSDRDATSMPKPWLTNLITRMNADQSAYLAADEILADPTLLKYPRVEIPVWISLTGDEVDAKLCLNGYRIDTKNCTIDFKSACQVLPADGDVVETVTIEDFDLLGVWITVATILEFPQTFVTAGGSQYLANPIHQLIRLTQLTPERRFNSWLPDLAGTNNSITKIAEALEERYLDVTQELIDAGNSALAETAQIETPIDAKLPFFPIWDLGDQVKIVGRNLGATGNEVITDITYDVHEQFVTSIKATNVMKRVNQSKLVGMRK